MKMIYLWICLIIGVFALVLTIILLDDKPLFQGVKEIVTRVYGGGEESFGEATSPIVISEVYSSNKSSIITLSQTYIDSYFDWKFTEINKTYWKANFTVDKDFWSNVTYCRNLNNPTQKATCFQTLCTSYLSDYLDCNSLGNRTRLLNDITNFANYPLKNLTSNIRFSNFQIDLTEGKASFNIFFPNGITDGERAEFGFGSTLIWTTNGIITFDDDAADPASYIANITNTNSQSPNFTGTLTKFAVLVNITTAGTLEAGEGTYFWHCETNTCADTYLLGSILQANVTVGVKWVNLTNSALLSRIEHNGIDSEFLKANESADFLDGGENLNYVAKVVLEYTPPLDSCSCPTPAAEWEILNGDECSIDNECTIYPYKFKVIDGRMSILNGGYIRAGGCYIKDEESLFIENGGGLYCGN